MESDINKNVGDQSLSENDNFSASFQELLNRVPSSVRNFILGPERNQIITELKATYALTPTQGAVLETDFTLALLGVSEPIEFRENLVAAKVSPETADVILKEIYTRVFSRFENQPKQDNELALQHKPEMMIVNEPTITPKSPPATPIVSSSVRPVVPPAPNTTPLVKAYVADPYRESVE